MSASSSASRPALVRSAQADRLLGNGIKQVARCTHCTRPLGKDAALTGPSLCSRCGAEAAALENKATAKQTVPQGNLEADGHASATKAGIVHFLAEDADIGVIVSEGGASASCSAEAAWLGVRAAPLVLHGAYWVEFEIKSDCLLRVGWGAPNSRRALGTDERSFGYGGTGMKSHANRFEPYGKVHEGSMGSVITCLLDRRDARSQTISYMMDGVDLGVAFRAPLWMASVPLQPAVCGREDWKVSIHGSVPPRYPVPPEFKPLSDMVQLERSSEEVDGRLKADELFAPAPKETARELRKLDVPDENLLEFRSSGDETLDEGQLMQWLERQCEVLPHECHLELAESGHTAVLACATHRLARSVLTRPPPMTEVHPREAFSQSAVDVMEAIRPENRGETTDQVARRFIAGALADDVAVSRQQLRQLRGKSSKRSSCAESLEASAASAASTKRTRMPGPRNALF